MSKLCLGTYLTVLTECKNNPKTSGQRKILNALVSCITNDAASEVSKIRKGTKDLEGYVSDEIHTVVNSTKDFSMMQDSFEKTVVPLLNPNKIPEAISSISRIILEDNNIGDDYIIDEVKNIKKEQLPDSTLFV